MTCYRKMSTVAAAADIPCAVPLQGTPKGIEVICHLTEKGALGQMKSSLEQLEKQWRYKGRC